MTSDTEDVMNDKIRRRTRSVTRAEEICIKHQKQRRSQPDKPYVEIKINIFYKAKYDSFCNNRTPFYNDSYTSNFPKKKKTSPWIV